MAGDLTIHSIQFLVEFLLVRHEEQAINKQKHSEPLVVSVLLVAMPFATSFLLLVVRPGAPRSVRSLLVANTPSARCELRTMTAM